jgi:hypothetical protein
MDASETAPQAAPPPDAPRPVHQAPPPDPPRTFYVKTHLVVGAFFARVVFYVARARFGGAVGTLVAGAVDFARFPRRVC